MELIICSTVLGSLTSIDIDNFQEASAPSRQHTHNYSSSCSGACAGMKPIGLPVLCFPFLSPQYLDFGAGTAYPIIQELDNFVLDFTATVIFSTVLI